MIPKVTKAPSTYLRSVSQRVLITGASGFLAQRLAAYLDNQGYDIVLVSRSRFDSKWPVYTWDVDQRRIDDVAFNDVDTVVNLAGAHLGKRWTKRYRKEIVSSRVDATRVLGDWLATHSHAVKSYVAISGTGMYGHRPGEVLTEESAPGTGFLSTLSAHWEQEQKRIEQVGIRTVVLRPGIVLAADAPVMKPFLLPMRFFIRPVAGSGKQIISWIHIDDIMAVFKKVISEGDLSGTFNASAPEPTTNRQFCIALARAYGLRTLPTRAPAIVLKLFLGEKAMMLLSDTRVSSDKLAQAGFAFRFPRIREAAEDIAGRTILAGNSK